MKKLLWNLLRWGVPVAILAYLLYDATRNDSFVRLRNEPKHWGYLALALLLCFVAVALTIGRWYYLVRVLQIPLRVRDAFRLGFLGYLLNFVSPGSVGGDLFKAVFLARDRPGRRAEVAITVIVDRLVGLYALFLVGTAAILFTGVWRSNADQVRIACQVMFWCTGVGTVALIASSLPSFAEGVVSRWLQSLPRIGPILERLAKANRMYYRHFWAMPLAVLMSVGVHALYAVGIWLIAIGLLSDAPSLDSHFVIVPTAMATGAIPLAPNGLGTFELVVKTLYQYLPGGTEAAASAGLLVALGYRVITVLIAAVGAVVYVWSRREMSEVLHEAHEVAEGDNCDPHPESLASAY
ncbi:MAG: flippase-like domain-containing protein [Pirellulales bacterium]|nr:flippase-like domain-containing protein [Pirellulales bacterium]